MGRRMTLKGQISLCLAAFFLALAGQIFLSFYQSGTVLRELDDQMGNFNAISRFQNGVERSLSAMEDYRWEYGDAKALEKTFAAFCGMAEVYKCCHVITYREPSSITNIINGKQPIIAISDLGMVIVLSAESEYRRFNKPGYRFFGPAIVD